MKKALRTIDPSKVSASFRALNVGIFGPAPVIEKEEPVKEPKIPRRGKMNVTETRFEHQLTSMKFDGIVESWEFEGVTLHLGGGAKYTPDFLVRRADKKLIFVETKGPLIRDAAMVRFRVASEKWGWLGEFQMWQFTKGNWSQIR